MHDRALRISREVVSIVSIVVALSARAEASPKPVRLVWIRGERTETCVGPNVLEHRVEARLGRSTFSASAPRAVEGVIQHEGDHWIAHLYVRDESGALEGSRDLMNDGLDCAPLEDAVVLAIALAIDPESALRPPSPAVSLAPLPNPPSAPEPRPPPPAPLAPTPPSVRIEAPAFRASSTSIPPPNGAVTFRSLLATPGLLPRASVGLAVAAEVPLYRILDGTAGVLYFPEVESQPDFAFGLTAAWLGACASPRLSARVALSLCGKVFLGAIHAVVEVLEPVSPGDHFWAAGGLSAGLRARLVGPLAFEVGAELDLPVTREAFVVGGESSPAFQETVVGGVGFLGLGVTIP